MDKMHNAYNLIDKVSGTVSPVEYGVQAQCTGVSQSYAIDYTGLVVHWVIIGRFGTCNLQIWLFYSFAVYKLRATNTQSIGNSFVCD